MTADPVPDHLAPPDPATMDPQARRFLAMVALGGTPGARVPIAERRASFEQLMRFSRPPDAAVDAEDRVVPGCGGAIASRLYTPGGLAGPSPGLVYFHGGGLVAGSLATHDGLCRTLAAEAGCRILAVDYRLAPEHPFPAGILDALAATRHVLRHADALGLDPAAIGIGGDSGGATLATIVAHMLRRHDRLRHGRLKAQVLLCPVLDFGEISASKQAYGAGYLLDRATMEQDLAHYAPRRPLADPRISPLRTGDLAGMPTAIIHTAGFDPLRDEGFAYAARLRAAGVDVRHSDHAGLVHHFYGLTGIVAAARPALARIGRDIAAALG